MQRRAERNQPEAGHQRNTYVCTFKGLLKHSHHLLLKGYFINTLWSAAKKKHHKTKHKLLILQGALFGSW